MSENVTICVKCDTENDVSGVIPGTAIRCKGCQDIIVVQGESHEGSDREIHDALIGQAIGGYEIIEKIGHGGMACVYKAKQSSLDRIVAIKLLSAEQSLDERIAERFEREAKATAKLSHANIVQIYDVGFDQGVNYIAMEYVDGETVQDILNRDGLIAVEKAVEIIKQVLKALSRAHREGIIHRDIKPQNILVNKDGEIKVSDFGIARVSTVDPTISDSVFGTPLYMSPEQANRSEPDVRSDIYNLGATFYHIVCGVPPFAAPTPMSLVVKHLTQTPRPPEEIIHDLPQKVCRIIEKMMEKHPDDRYQTAEEALEDIEELTLLFNSPNNASTYPVEAAASTTTLNGPADSQQRLFESEMKDVRVSQETDVPDASPRSGVSETAPAQSEMKASFDENRSHAAESNPEPANSSDGGPGYEGNHTLNDPDDSGPTKLFRDKWELSWAILFGIAVIVAASIVAAIVLSQKRARSDMVLIPAGEFVYRDGGQRVFLEAFYMDKYEVTNAQYKEFLDYVKETNDHSKCYKREPKNKDHTPRFWRHRALTKLRNPVVGVDWYDAYAYARWAGKRLPTDEEWEKAARGPNGSEYPWGNEWRPKNCNWGDKGRYDGYLLTAPVGVYANARSFYGCYDMAGNVWEWVDSGYREHHCILRGGAWNSDKDEVKSTNRGEAPLNARLESVGFRCVKNK